MKPLTMFKLAAGAIALASAFTASAAVLDEDRPEMHKAGDGIQDKTTNVFVRNWGEAKPKAAVYQGAVLESAAAPAAPKPDIAIPPMPQADAGQCYARALNPPLYQTRTEKRIKQPAGERLEVIPARYETVTEQVLVKDASTQLEVIPAQYETGKDRVMVKRAYTRTVAIPATYDTYTEQVLVRPAYKTWKPGSSGSVTKVDEATGEVMCLVEVPAEYKTVSKQVLRTPASTKTIDEPAQYEDVEKVVLKTPSRTVQKQIPAQYEPRQVTKLMEPAKEVRVPVAAVYEDVPLQTLVSDASYEWRQVLCETNATPEKIKEIQQALSTRGFYSGQLDGKLTPDTVNAVQAFEKANGMREDKYLDIDTVTALGVSPR